MGKELFLNVHHILQGAILLSSILFIIPINRYKPFYTLLLEKNYFTIRTSTNLFHKSNLKNDEKFTHFPIQECNCIIDYSVFKCC